MPSVDESLAEAGQEILEGPFEDCVYCEGSGTKRDSQGVLSLCLSCDGSGKKIRRQYQWACDLLGCTEKGLKAVLDLRKSAENSRKAVKRRADMEMLDRLNKQAETEKQRAQRSLDEILKRVANHGSDYYGKRFRKNGKV